MNIIFKKLCIQGFQSIGDEINIDIENMGTILVRGINEYEKNTISNGSGKSSIFESINFCIYGKTSSGINNPVNRYYNNGCHVIINVVIDGREYIISRYIKSSKYGTGLKLEKVNDNGTNDISGRNKTDTEKIIKEIFNIPQDIFLSTVILSQGFSNRLSLLSPSGRKDRIETLTNTSSVVDKFKDSINNLKSNYNDKISKYSSNIWSSEGKISTIESEISFYTNKISNTDTYDIDKESKSIIENKIAKLERMIEEINNNISSTKDSKSKISQLINSIESSIKSNDSNIKLIERNMNSVESKVCPLCNQSIDDNITDNLRKEYTSDVRRLRNENIELNSKLELLNNKYNTCSDNISVFNSKKKKLEETLIANREKYNKILESGNINEYNNRLKSLKEEKESILLDISNNKDKEFEYKSKCDILDHCSSLVSRQFRSYLLQNIIDFMNSRLLEYSSMLFSNDNDIIRLVADSSKLDIYLEDSLYDSLSGGEKRKVDIAITFTQRDLAINMSSFSSNILVLDEILDNLDQKATSIVLDMISNISFNIESMFIISHNNYSIPYDGIITVKKDISRNSTIEIS